MNDSTKPLLLAVPGGGAELRLVLRLDWGDVAELGRLASELASKFQRPVSLDEAASHKLSARPETVRPLCGTVDANKDTPVVFPVRASVEHSRQAVVAAGRPTVSAPSEEPTEKYGAHTARQALPTPA